VTIAPEPDYPKLLQVKGPIEQEALEKRGMAMPDENKEPNPVLPESKSPTTPQPGQSGDAGASASESATQGPAGKSEAAAAPSAAPPAKPEAVAKAPETAKSEVATKPAATAATGETPAVPVATVASGEKPAAPAMPAAAKPVAKPAPKPEGPKPEPWDSYLSRRLRSQYGSGIREASTYLGQKYLVVDSTLLYEILLSMKKDELFDYCVDITAVHYPKREAQFDILYVLYSFHHNERVRIKTYIKDGESLRTAVGIWETANWLEREVYDMFGIVFDGHPDLKRILLPDGWKGHPLRKDYPILQQDQEWVQINLGIESGQ
jgi:NADH-quinone oxidoreductase subunit C